MRRSTRLSMPGRRLVAVGVVAITASVAACGDAATAPKAPTIATAIDGASPLVLSLGATVKVRLADTTGTTLTEPGWVQFTWGGINDTLSVRDNSAKDQDPAVGFIKVTLTKTNQYKACFIRSAHYMSDLAGQAKYQVCSSSTSPASTVDMGTLIGQRSPMFKLIAKDEFGALAGGATYDLVLPNDNWHLIFQDGNGSYDESAGANGVTIYTLNFPFWVKICEVKPPSKLVLTSPACYYVNAKWGQTYTYTFTHEHAIY
jgi:hypothetical protein